MKNVVPISISVFYFDFYFYFDLTASSHVQEEALQYGEVQLVVHKQSATAKLGVSLAALGMPPLTRVCIGVVDDGSVAATSGCMAGDIVVAVGDQGLRGATFNDVTRAIKVQGQVALRG